MNPPGQPTPACAGRLAIVASAYLFLALGMTFPLWAHPATSLPAGVIDVWSNHWNFWWWKHCLWGLRGNPFQCDTLFFPTGVEAVFHTHSIFNMIFSAPVNLVLGEAAAYNFCALFAIAASGFFAFLLARDLTGDDGAAFIAGLVYAFIPQRLEFMTENLNLMSSQFIPLAVFFLRRAAREGGWKNIAGLAAAYALNALADWHLGLELTLMLLPIAGWHLYAAVRPRGEVMRDWSAAGVMAAAVLLPAIWPMLRVMAGEEGYYQKRMMEKGLDAALLIMPHWRQPLWGGTSLERFAALGHDTPGFACYLGFVPLLLAAHGAVMSPKRSWKWGAMFAVMLVLALGAHARWNGRVLNQMTLPFDLLSSIPLLRLLRVANRFFIPASLAWGVLTGFGWASLRRKPRGLWIAACLGILIEFAWIPYPVQRVRLSPGYDLIANSPNEGAVLDLPAVAGVGAVVNMRAQTRHGRPIAGGYLATMPPESLGFMARNPGFGDLNSIDPPLKNPIHPDRLREMGFAFVTLRKDRSTGFVAGLPAPRGDDLLELKKLRNLGGMPPEKWDRLNAELRERIGAPVFEDGEIVIFELK